VWIKRAVPNWKIDVSLYMVTTKSLWHIS
jgi:hypothetical protein